MSQLYELVLGMTFEQWWARQEVDDRSHPRYRSHVLLNSLVDDHERLQGPGDDLQKSLEKLVDEDLEELWRHYRGERDSLIEAAHQIAREIDRRK